MQTRLAQNERNYLLAWATGVVVASAWISPLLGAPATLGLFAAYLSSVCDAQQLAALSLRVCIPGPTLLTHFLLYWFHPLWGVLVAALAVVLVLLHAASGLAKVGLCG